MEIIVNEIVGSVIIIVFSVIVLVIVNVLIGGLHKLFQKPARPQDFKGYTHARATTLAGRQTISSDATLIIDKRFPIPYVGIVKLHLTASEFAKLAKVDRATVTRWIKKGRITKLSNGAIQVIGGFLSLFTKGFIHLVRRG
jgi:hypothetical protein